MVDDRNINVAPMQKRIRYKNHVIDIEFDPTKKRWLWKFVHNPQPLRFSGAATTQVVAEHEAKKEVDKLVAGSQ